LLGLSVIFLKKKVKYHNLMNNFETMFKWNFFIFIVLANFVDICIFTFSEIMFFFFFFFFFLKRILNQDQENILLKKIKKI